MTQTMAAIQPLRPVLRLARPPQPRTFLSALLPSASPPAVQTLRAERILPYPSAPIYSIIADVPSYASFLPYCTQSRITHWSAPDPTTGRTWPSIGVLTSGFGTLTETFTSRVYCIPGRVVESVGGATQTALPRDLLRHHFHPDTASVPAEASGALLTHLRNTWTVESLGHRQTRIQLSLEFQFANPMYAALSAAVAPKVADAMVKAFEERVRRVLTDCPAMIDAKLEHLDGSRLRGASV